MEQKPPVNQPRPTAIIVSGNPEGEGKDIQKMFESLGYEAVVCKEPSRALKVQETRHQRWQPGIFIVDMILPQTSGYEVSRRIMEKWTDVKIPLIVMTNHPTVEDELEATTIGAIAVMKKPVTIEVLKQILEKEKMKKLKTQIGNIVLEIEQG